MYAISEGGDAGNQYSSNRWELDCWGRHGYSPLTEPQIMLTLKALPVRSLCDPKRRLIAHPSLDLEQA
jgi:hypothetical protein